MSMPALPIGGNKRHKGADGSGPSGSPPSGSFHQGPPYPYQQAPYGQQQFPMQHPQQPGYNMWQPGQQQPPPPYGNQPPPHSHPYGQQPGMYRQPPSGGAPPGGPPMTPDRSGPNWNAYRGPPPQQGQGRRQNGASNTPQRSKGGAAGNAASGNAPPVGMGTHPQPPPGAQQYQQWGQPQQPWPPQAQWGGAPPHVWQQGPQPPMPPQPSPPPPNSQTLPQHMYHGGPPGGNQWAGGTSSNLTSPARPASRLRASPDNGFPLQGGVPAGMTSPDAMCNPVGIDGGRTSVGPDGGAYGDSRQGHEDDGKGKASSESKHSSRDDKGRGSYRCGRCGVPKKGHICPYQPKLKRRPDEPPPVMRNAAVQVEMDEFMTLRRLNIQIQGFPESYASDPHMSDDMVVGEPHPPMGVASMAGGLVGHPGVVGSEGGGEAAPSPSVKSHTTSMQTDSAPMDSSGGGQTPKEMKSTSTST